MIYYSNITIHWFFIKINYALGPIQGAIINCALANKVRLLRLLGNYSRHRFGRVHYIDC